MSPSRSAIDMKNLRRAFDRLFYRKPGDEREDCGKGSLCLSDLRGDTRYGWPRADRFNGGASGRVPVACRLPRQERRQSDPLRELVAPEHSAPKSERRRDLLVYLLLRDARVLRAV